MSKNSSSSLGDLTKSKTEVQIRLRKPHGTEGHQIEQNIKICCFFHTATDSRSYSELLLWVAGVT